MDDDVLDAWFGGDDQVGVQENLALLGTTAPTVFHAANLEVVCRDTMSFCIGDHVVKQFLEDDLGTFAEPADGERFYS